mgnify:CR=1 FL=1
MHIVQAHLGTPESLIVLDYTSTMAPHRGVILSSRRAGAYCAGLPWHSRIIDFA